MSKKLCTMIKSIVTAVGAIAVAIVTYAHPTGAVAINAAITIAVGAINQILDLFVKEEPAKVENKTAVEEKNTAKSTDKSSK